MSNGYNKLNKQWETQGRAYITGDDTSVEEGQPTCLSQLKLLMPDYHVRLIKMDLEPTQRDSVAYFLGKAHFLQLEGECWKDRGDRLYSIQMTASSIVPVLIGILGSFDSAVVDLIIRVAAIVLSVAATICAAVESVYAFRLRGQVRRAYGDHINDLWQAFETLSGPIFDDEFQDEPPTDSASATYTIPDLSAIPMPVLEAHIKHMQAPDAAASVQPLGKGVSKKASRKVRHADKFKRFAYEANLLNADARHAAFVGQDVGARQSASKATGRRGKGRAAKGDDAGEYEA